MSRSPKFVGKQYNHVVALLKKHGITKTRDILAADEKNELAGLRNAKVFPEAVTVSMPTLWKIGVAEEIEMQHGRANPVAEAGSNLVRRAVSLVRKLGAVAAATKLAEEGTVVCAATLRKMASEHGVKLVRGRRKAA